MNIMNWWKITYQALLKLWDGFVAFIPNLIGALVIFIIGWFISVLVGRIVAEILRKLKFNQLFEKGGLKGALEKAEIKVDASGFVGAIFKWILVIAFLTAAVEVLGFSQFVLFLSRVLGYLPNVIVAALIFVVAVIVADILEKIVRAAVESTKVGYGQAVGAVVKWSIWVFAIMAMLYQLRVAPALIQTLLTGIIGLIVIAGGLAFGLGGKEVAAEILQGIRRKLRE